MLILNNLRRAERFVSEQQNAGANVRWDNYDIVFFRATEKGRTSSKGVYRNGQYGFDNRFPVTEQGTWEVESRNVKRVKRTRD